MNVSRKIQTGSMAVGLVICLLIAAFAPSAHANVYATNIKLNGGLNSVTNSSATPVSISYVLNEPATLGTTINILSGANVVRTISIASGNAGTLRGTNTVVWDGNATGGSGAAAGTYSISITPSATGFTNWTQTSLDTNAGNYVFSPRGIAVNNNSNSPYFGRVFVGNAKNGPSSGGANPVPGDLDGILKVNADGRLADEGQGNTNGTQAGYKWVDDGFNDSPHFLRYGQDDRIYALDVNISIPGVIVACDMIMSTNQVVLPTANYANNPYKNEVSFGGGWEMMDVTDAGTANGRLWLGDYDQYQGPNTAAGVWVWHMVNGVANPADTTGTQAIALGGDLSLWPAGGFMMDESSNIFVSQDPLNSSDQRPLAMVFTNWNGVSTLTNGTRWKAGGGDTTFSGIYDTALSSRANPKFVAYAISGNAGGIRVLNATNGATILTNLDAGNSYYGVAWDAVGNLYGASASLSRWRAFSPPGTNQATTVATETVQIGGSTSSTVYITSIAISNNNVIINFTGPASASAAAFTLLGASTASGPYSNAGGANITQISPGVFQATAPKSGAIQFYRVKMTQATGSPTRPTITSLVVSNSLVTVNFTGSSGDPVTAFTLQSAGAAPGPYADVTAAYFLISPGVYKATATKSGPMKFYRVRR